VTQVTPVTAPLPPPLETQSGWASFATEIFRVSALPYAECGLRPHRQRKGAKWLAQLICPVGQAAAWPEVLCSESVLFPQHSPHTLGSIDPDFGPPSESTSTIRP